MLVPAIKYKNELNAKFEDLLYSADMYCLVGYDRSTPYTVPDTSNDRMYPYFEYAILNDKEELVGYLKYCIEICTDTVTILGVISFENKNTNYIGFTSDSKNPTDLTVAKDTYKLFRDLIANHRRIEWKAVEGCKAIPAYISICEKHDGVWVHHRDVFKDISGNYRDAYDFEILTYETPRFPNY